MRLGPAAAADFGSGPSRPDKKILERPRERRISFRTIRNLTRPQRWHRACKRISPERFYQVVLDAFTKRVVRALALYWCENPFACDTAEGIRHWWLSPDEAVSTEQVNRALAWLCDQALVERLLPADGRGRFRRASGADAALRLLAQSGEPSEVQPRRVH